MPLQDSFSRRPSDQSAASHAPKPNRLPKSPSREDLEFTLSCSRNNPGVPLSLMWKKLGKTFLLTVTAPEDLATPEAAWVLYGGADLSDRSVLWTFRTQDINAILPMLEEVDSAGEVITGDHQTITGDNPVLDNALEPGAIFADQYEIVNEIGSGGMGVVLRAYDRKFDRAVAIKVLHLHLAGDQLSKKRFEQEAKSAMSLTHPHLIRVYHYGYSAQGLPFLVMEYIDGYGLDQLIARDGQLDLATFLEVFMQSCNGLKFAHEKGIIHRDLKPSNLMILKEDAINVKIVDFGISKMIDKRQPSQDLTLAGDIVGSPLYMSPEQCKGDALDVRSDVYSLGCLMYQALTGIVPFEGENPLQTLGKHICDAPRPLTTVRPELTIPAKLQSMVLKMLEKEPANRFASVQDIYTELEAVSEAINPKTAPDEGAPPVVAAPSVACQILVDAGDLPATTLDAAKRVQKLLRAGAISLMQAANALGRAHLRGGQIDVAEDENAASDKPGIETPVEAILVEAGLITNAAWRTLLQLQQRIRSGQLSKEEAIQEYRKQHPKAAETSTKKDVVPLPKDVLDLLKQSGVVSNEDVASVSSSANDDGTELAKRLVASGKLDNKLLLAARQCLSLIESDRLRMERAVIALNYCHRSRVGFYQAVEELGWERP